MHDNINEIPASCVDLLVENKVNICQPPLEAFNDQGLEVGNIEEVDE
jgi:hypothetical protein